VRLVVLMGEYNSELTGEGGRSCSVVCVGAAAVRLVVLKGEYNTLVQAHTTDVVVVSGCTHHNRNLKNRGFLLRMI
jgi:hypothetical protein